MPTPGISLVGFLDQKDAVDHLQNTCIPPDNTQDALIAAWNAAKARLGAPFANAGNPDIRQIPAAYQNHVNQVLIHPPFQAEWKGAGAALVEIDPILAYQITVDSERWAQHISHLSCPPTEQQLFDVCLPTEPKTEQLKIFPGQNSLILKAKSLNVRIFKGIGQPNLMGVQFGVSPPYCHVVRHGGRCYLFNGYQRAVGLRLAGITHMPCILRDVKDHTDVGLNPPAFFSMDLLQSKHPPTLGHFTQERGYRVSLRSHYRIVHISWAEHAVPDE
jgi:hypothetical protein